eukprot:m.7413 g.7413  ORF g.7413 m.7413 type:complete len:468 (+) comp2444_c0_seq1:247-1650(+)
MSDDGPLPGGTAPAGVADTTAAEDTENDLARGLAAFSTSRRSPQQTNLTSPSSSDTALKAPHQDTAAASVEAAHAQASPASPTTGAPAADTAGAGDVGDTLGAVAESLSVRCGTFNVNAKEVVMENGRFVNLSAWVGSDKDADICVFGLQELDDDPQILMLNLASPKVEEWENALEACMPKGHYVKLASHSMVGIVLIAYVKTSLRDRVTNVMFSSLPTGMMGFGNKGGVGIRFDVDKTGMCFISSHFAAHQGAVDKRNQDFRDILQGMLFWECPVKESDYSQVMQHERVIWVGDLNYRIDCERDKLMARVDKAQYGKLLKYDQLEQQKQSGKVFKGFEEAAITFAPTYKYDPGTDTFDTSPKARLPAWCDRVLYMSVDGFGIAATDYTSHPEIMFSDHKPVSATLKVALCSADDTRVRRPVPLVPLHTLHRPTNVTEAAQGAVTSARTMGGNVATKLMDTFKGTFG